MQVSLSPAPPSVQKLLAQLGPDVNGREWSEEKQSDSGRLPGFATLHALSLTQRPFHALKSLALLCSARPGRARARSDQTLTQ